MKKNKFTRLAATVVAVACSAGLGYRAGQERPREFRRPAVINTVCGETLSFGWDTTNQCVATWGYRTNGTSHWTRLK